MNFKLHVIVKITSDMKNNLQAQRKGILLTSNLKYGIATGYISNRIIILFKISDIQAYNT